MFEFAHPDHVARLGHGVGRGRGDGLLAGGSHGACRPRDTAVVVGRSRVARL